MYSHLSLKQFQRYPQTCLADEWTDVITTEKQTNQHQTAV